MTENQDPLAGLKAANEHLSKETPVEGTKRILLNAKVFLLDLSPTKLVDGFNYLRDKCSISQEWWESYKDEIREDRKKKHPQEDKPTQSEILLQLAADAELFHTAGHECFSRIQINEHKEVWPIQSRGFQRWLLRKFYKAEGKPPQSEALQAVLNVLEAQASFDGPERQVWIRLAEHEGNFYLDLGTPPWDAVEITPTGWQVIADPPVYFRRSGSMKALPYPESGGDVSDLRKYLNVSSESDFILMVSTLLAGLRPYGPYPITTLNGEQDSAKTTTARVLGSMVDPNISPLRSIPREERDLAVFAHNSWVLGFDNLSGLSHWLADAFCRLSTGGGVSNRELYTNREENILDAMRPIIMNGIDSLTERLDLADRALIFNLKQIPDENRKPEKLFWNAFNQDKAKILGALLDAVSVGLKNLPHIKLDSLPRMADFALWIAACEQALPWEEGGFLDAYTGNRAEAVELSLEADVVAMALRAHMAGLNEEWEGTAQELYEVLENHVSENTRKSKAWPKAPNWMSNRLRRAATFLRKVGIEIEFGHSTDRKIRIVRQGEKNCVPIVNCVLSQEQQDLETDANKKNCVRHGASCVRADANREIASDRKASKYKGKDEKDANDANLHTQEGNELGFCQGEGCEAQALDIGQDGKPLCCACLAAMN